MQQVGRQRFVPAQVADPQLFPVPLPPAPPHRRLLVKASQFAVLHRRGLNLAALAFALIAAGAGLYMAREPVTKLATDALAVIEGQAAGAGFAIKSIEITGQRLTADRDIIRLLTLGSGQSILTFDVAEAQARLKWLRAVDSARIRKIYPDRIIVDILEKTPIARWRLGNITWLIDDRGQRIGTAGTSYSDLPLIVGSGAADDSAIMMRLMDKYPDLKTGLVALSRISDRRWDLIYKSGLRVQLPETGTSEALMRLEQYQAEYQLLDRDVTRIDLRVEGLVTLKPGPQAAEYLASIRPKPHKPKGSSDYETPTERQAEATDGPPATDTATGTAPE